MCLWGCVTGKKSREKKERHIKPAAENISKSAVQLKSWILALLCLVPLLVYLHTISFEFVYDDEIQILRNPWIRDWSKVVQFFTTDVWAFSRIEGGSNYYRPLHMVAHALGYSLAGFRPEVYHLINILLHVFSTLLVAGIGLRLTRSRSIASAAGLIFALHPIHTESVTWIAAVTDPLCAVFYFGALYFYLKDIDSPGNKKVLAGILLLFMCALLSKEMAFAFPLAALWADWSLKRTLRWNRYALLLCVFAVYALLRISAMGPILSRGSSFLNADEHILSLVVLFASNIVRLFVPYGITAYHVFHPTRSVLDIELWWSIAVLIAAGLFIWRQRTKPPTLFLCGFALISLLPVMNISGIGQETVFADRYLYIPSLASCLLIPMLVHSMLKPRLQTPSFFSRHALYIILGPLLLVYGAMLVHTSFLWRDARTLYSKSLERSPENRMFTDLLAQYYFRKGDYKRAEPLFSKLVDLCRNSPFEDRHSLSQAYTGLGGIHFRQQRYLQAKEYFEKAYALKVRNESVLQNLGSVNLVLGNYAAAAKYFGEALSVNPRNELVYNNLASMHVTLKQYEAAIENAKKAIAIYPGLGQAYISMGQAYAGLGMMEKAREAYRKAVQVDPAQKAVVDEEMKQFGG